MKVFSRYVLCVILFFTTLYGSDRKRRFEPLPDKNYVIAQSIAAKVYGLVSADPALIVFSYLGDGTTTLDLKESWSKVPATPHPLINCGIYRLSGYEHMLLLGARFLKHNTTTNALYIDEGSFLYNSQDDTLTPPEKLTRYRGRDHGPRQLLRSNLSPITTWSPGNIRTTVKPIASTTALHQPQLYSSFCVERFPETLIAQAARAHEESRPTKKTRRQDQSNK